jgi:4a-hydroxytetrahydrobiopterin dehydratase
MVEVTFYTRANCPLCDKAKAAIAESRVPVRMTEVNIDADPALRERYTNDVPVVHMNGAEAFRHKVDAVAFAEAVQLLEQGWLIVDDHHLEKSFAFPDFATALAFTNQIGAIAEEHDHHPDIHLAWGSVRIALWTHMVNRLTRKDYALATRIQRLVAS